MASEDSPLDEVELERVRLGALGAKQRDDVLELLRNPLIG